MSQKYGQQYYELLKKVHAQITAHPEGHRQETWVDFPDGVEAITLENFSCGTTLCIAGWAVILSGGTVYADAFGDDAFVTTDREESLFFHARSVLGFGYAEAEYIFLDTDNASAIAKLEYIIGEYEKEGYAL